MKPLCAKYNYASAKRTTKKLKIDRRKEEAAFNICSSLSVRKSAVQTAGEYYIANFKINVGPKQLDDATHRAPTPGFVPGYGGSSEES
ncbi:hypothetical protein Tco_0969758 [Tanacetum coccineum]